MSNLNPQQFGRDDVPVEGYDPEQMGPKDANARFTHTDSFDLRRVKDLFPSTGREHDENSGINDGYYHDMEHAVRDHVAPPIVATEYRKHGVVELHDGWHRGSIALANGITHHPAYVHQTDATPPEWVR